MAAQTAKRCWAQVLVVHEVLPPRETFRFNRSIWDVSDQHFDWHTHRHPHWTHLAQRSRAACCSMLASPTVGHRPVMQPHACDANFKLLNKVKSNQMHPADNQIKHNQTNRSLSFILFYVFFLLSSRTLDPGILTLKHCWLLFTAPKHANQHQPTVSICFLHLVWLFQSCHVFRTYERSSLSFIFCSLSHVLGLSRLLHLGRNVREEDILSHSPTSKSRKKIDQMMWNIPMMISANICKLLSTCPKAASASSMPLRPKTKLTFSMRRRWALGHSDTMWNHVKPFETMWNVK